MRAALFAALTETSCFCRLSNTILNQAKINELKDLSKKKEFLTYKGKHLVRQGNTIYYGDMADDNVIIMQILAKKEVGDKDKAEVASKVSVQLLSTDPNASMKERIIKTSEKKGLYAAMDIAEIWLQRALAHE